MECLITSRHDPTHMVKVSEVHVLDIDVRDKITGLASFKYIPYRKSAFPSP